MKNAILIPLSALAVITMPLTPAAPPQIVNVTTEADTGIHEGFPNNNLGGHTHAPAGTTNQEQRTRALFRFNLEGVIPQDATIESVILRLRVTGTPIGGGANSSFSLHRVLQNWNEGDKSGNTGRGASNGEATWNARSFPDQLWDPSGGGEGTDYVGAPSATTAVSGIGTYAFESAELLQDVQ